MNGSSMRAFCGVQYRSDAKVGKKNITIIIEKNIFWFDITVNDVWLVGIGKRLANLRENGNGLLYRRGCRRPMLKQIPERPTRSVLAYEIGKLTVYASFIKRKNMRVCQPCEKPSFLKKPLTILRRVDAHSMQKL